MIAEGTVGEFGVTSKGTPKVKIGADWYFAGRGVDFSSLKVGQKVGVEYSFFGEKNNLRSIKSWALLPHQPAQGSVGTAIAVGLDPRQDPALKAPEKPHYDEAELRFISNCIGQAIASKAITSPGEILPWFLSAQAALKGKGVDPDADIPI